MDPQDFQDFPDQNRLESLIDSLERLADPDLRYPGTSSSSIPVLPYQDGGSGPTGVKSTSAGRSVRSKETVKKRTNALFHMIRVLGRSGLCVESFCTHIDSEGTGTIRRAHFAKILKNIGFPFSWKDLNEVLLRYSNAPKFDIVDYQSFLNDAGVTSKSEKLKLDLKSDVNTNLHSGWQIYTRILLNVKRVLMNNLLTLGKQKYDIHGMFAVWDKANTGTVTSTQFLRVLVRLQVDLSDQEQDYLVDLLDTTSMGCIDYDNILTFCLTGSDSDPSSGEKMDEGPLRSTDELMVATPYLTQSNESSIEFAPGSLTTLPFVDFTDTRSLNEMEECDDFVSLIVPERPLSALPLTASLPKTPPNIFNSEEKESYNLSLSDVKKGGSSKSMSSFKGRLKSASEYVLNNPDLVINDDDDDSSKRYIPDPSTDSKSSSRRSLPSEKEMFKGDSDSRTSEIKDSKSHRSSSASLSDINEYNFACAGLKGDYSPSSSAGNNPNPVFESSSGDGGTKIKRGRWEGEKGGSDVSEFDIWSRPRRDSTESSREDFTFMNNIQVIPTFHNESPRRIISDDRPTNYLPALNISALQETSKSSADHSPVDDDASLARQTLAVVREMVLSRHKAGKPLHVIYSHFDRVGKAYFDANDFKKATADLRIEITESVAKLAIAQIALDSFESVTYGEFHVYILDPLHVDLEKEVLGCMAEQLEKHGRAFQSTLQSLFWNDEKIANRGQKLRDGFVSKSVFISVLKKFELKLSNRDIDRVVARFDINNSETFCCTTRFIKMVERSEQWRAVEENLSHQEIALQEASILRAELSNNKLGILADQTGSFGGRLLNEDMIAMAESLGIKVISEQHLLWIVRDALNIPLPAPWVLVQQGSGKSSYYNRQTDRTRQDHPLEHHFKELRDKFRKERAKGMTDNDTSSYRLSVENPRSSSQTFLHGFTNPQRPLTSDYGYGSASESSHQQLFLTERYDRDKKIRGLNSNDRGTWHLPNQQGNPFVPYNSFNIPSGSGPSRSESIRDLKLPGLPSSLKERIKGPQSLMTLGSSSTSFLRPTPGNPELLLLPPQQLQSQLPDATPRQQQQGVQFTTNFNTAAVADVDISSVSASISTSTSTSTALPSSSRDTIGHGSINTLRKEVKKKSISNTGIQNQKKNVNTVNTTGSGKQSIVDRLANIKSPNRK